MALDYYLVIQDINNEIEPALVMESLSQAFYLPKKPNSGFLIGVGVTINAFKEDDEDSLFGSPYPDICVAFRIDFKYGESGINTMRKVVVWLMSYFNGDMRLFLNEQQIFQRISSQLILNHDADFWIPESLESQSVQPVRVATSVG